MKDALVNYSKKAIAQLDYHNPRAYEGVVPKLITEIQKSFLVPRTTKTNLESFRERFGFDLPDDMVMS